MKQDANNITKKVIYGLFLFAIGVLIVYSVIYKFPAVFQETVTKVEKSVTVTDVGIADAVEKVYNSVVVITSYNGDNAVASGSGFIYKTKDNKSYIITNNHVISGSNNFKATYTDGSVQELKLVGSDEYADIAVLETDERENFNAVSIGKSEEMRVGDTAFTVGAPLDDTYSWTVTRGILSGKDRLVEVSLSNTNQSDYIMNVMQTDAAVNSGNSGGPLCNSNGEVVGVVNAKISSTGVEGIGFAIPIEVAIEKAEQVISGSKTEYPYLGISMLNVTSALSYPQYNSYLQQNKISQGVIVIDVEKNSSADNAGIKTNDIILSIDNDDVENLAFLRYKLYKYNVGDTIKLKVLRDGKEKTISVKLSSNGKKA